MSDDPPQPADEPVTGPGGHPILLHTPEDFASAFVNGWVVDGRSGGLIQGRLHSEGHVLMISPSSPLGTYEFMGYMEGGEYLMSVEATEKHRLRIEEINNDKSDDGAQLPDPPLGRTIFMHADPHDKLLVIGQQFIVNRVSTRNHFAELVALNAPHVYYNGQFLPDDIVEEINTWK
ncbi:hypothetical protein [Xanthomonas arboricola]|uniref:hypothetical protein n=1 Tax=Xanthomonas arboricola TaxID=56448 RepID=UPI0011B0B226|nr:hypothetical protein [Xanthomonas arboricola]